MFHMGREVEEGREFRVAVGPFGQDCAFSRDLEGYSTKWSQLGEARSD